MALLWTVSARAQTAGEPAATSAWVLQQAYWTDASGQADWQTAQTQSYTPFSGTFSGGYTTAVHWIRIRVAPSELTLALQVSPAWLDHLVFFDPSTGQGPIEAGDRVAQNSRNRVLGGLGASFELRPFDREREVWLRLDSTSSHRASIHVQPFHEAQVHAIKSLTWAAAYGAFLTFAWLALFALWWIRRDAVVRIFLWRHAVFVYYAMSYLGLPTLMWGHLLPPAAFDRAFSIAAIALLPMSIHFDRAFMASYEPHPVLLKGFSLFAALGWMTLLAFWLGWEREALRINVVLLILVSTFFVLTAMSARRSGETAALIPRPVMQAYYVAIWLSLILGLMSILGWFGTQEWTTYGLPVNGLLGSVLMMLLLALRAIRQVRLEQEARLKLQRVEQAMTFEQTRRQEQSRFLHMLVHELKTPLSVVSLALGTQPVRVENVSLAKRAVQDMKSIIDRCTFAENLAQASDAVAAEPVALLPLVQDIAKDLPGLPNRLQVRCAARETAVSSDERFVRMIVHNLLDNAQRYSRSDSLISVDMDVDLDSRLRLRVANAPGAAGWPDADRVFEKYYRAPGAEHVSGAGLGLHLSHQLAKALGGGLVYAPSAHRVEFEFWLPLNLH